MFIWKKRRISKINRHENNIGNHAAAVKDSGGVASHTEYAAYGLNRHASVGDFVPQFDADGNQTLLKTETAVWQVDYNAEKRPVRFTRVEGTSTTVVECAYDCMGRRATRKVSVNGSITLYQRFLYRGYLQIACCDLTRSNHPCLWIVTWDPSQPVATRPLAIQKDGTWYTYGWDLTKNICEVYGQHGYIRTAYTYAPYGQVTSTGDVEQPIQWSSEFNDTELGLVYYNYRHYNPMDGRWMGRDLLESLNLYKYVGNNIVELDSLGLAYVEYRTVRVSTGGFCSTICIKELNNPDLTPQVLVEKWIIPSWWEITKDAINTGEEQWRNTTTEEMYIYVSERDGKQIVERDAHTLFSRALKVKYEDYKIKEQVEIGNAIVTMSIPPKIPVGRSVATCMNKVRYILHFGKPVRISWWGRKSAPGWVMQGNPSRLNYRLSGKWEKHRFNQYSPYESYKTKEVPIQSVSWPNGDTFSIDGWWKGLFNQ